MAGAGGRGLGDAVNDGGVVGFTIDYSNGIREIRKGVPQGGEFLGHHAER